MKQLREWSFRFWLEPVCDEEVVPRALAEALVLDVAIPWAEARGYGIGGGPRESGGSWLLEFGLCITREEQLIPEADALKLAELMTQFCAGRDATLIGEVRDYHELNAELDAVLKRRKEESEAERQRMRENPKFRRPPRPKP